MSKKTTVTTENDIPIIDLAPLFGNDPRREYTIAQNLEPAFLGKGFLILINHGISKDLIKQTFQETQRFHNQSMEFISTEFLNSVDWL